jgi:hypothetical protein
VPVTVNLATAFAVLLDVAAAHLRKSKDETIEEALRCLFVLIPRPGDL